ncbi:MAG: hypothetical protein PHQ75_11975, partial [Thermoguttaceae bacterium]|nr:hypothetical protein [Thermoguttaceae bacterium]
MMSNEKDKNSTEAIRVILGYLNFSSGNHEPRFWSAWNTLFSVLSAAKSTSQADPLWRQAISQLLSELDTLAQTDEVFRSSERAKFVLVCLQEHVIPEYRKFHADLLYHQVDDLLFNSFFLAKTCERILSLESRWQDIDFVTSQVVRLLNDYIGYRPIPILEGDEKHEANPHEWVAPIILYRKGVGAAVGQYHDLIDKTFDIFGLADPELLRDAWFDPDKIEELVVDPRAYDFDHPVNRRPNYGFGTWDPNFIDKEGYYHRFVIHQITLDGIFQRTSTNEEGLTATRSISPEELLFEAAAVLAGTMLMGSGVSGDHVQTHDSTVTLVTLMPFIASYRDRFYELLINRIPQAMKKRLSEEEKKYFQPFAGARQSLNRYLAKKRADQLQRFHLARTYARMGYFEAGQKQAAIIDVASARFLCRIDCLIAQAHLLADRNQYKEAVDLLPELEDLLHRGIACGALPDPWTILGFSGEYSLFPSVDSTIHDHRLDDLIGLMNDIFDVQSRLQKEAAASGDSNIQADVSERMSDLAGWWDQFGSTEVSSVEGFSGEAAWESAAKVSTALAVWHKAGPAAGDVAFWRRHVERFQSPKAFVLLGEALLDQKDLISSMALLMHWLSQSEMIALTEGDYSFYSIVSRWFETLWQDPNSTDASAQYQRKTGASNESVEADSTSQAETATGQADQTAADKWKLMKSFMERLEANADQYWEVPRLELDPACFDSVSEKPSAGQKSSSGKSKSNSDTEFVDDDDDQSILGPLGDFISASECESFRQWYSLTMAAIPANELATRFPELARYVSSLNDDKFSWNVLCRLYALLHEIRGMVWSRANEDTVRLFTDRRYGILTFIDGFFQLIRFILNRTEFKIADTEPLSLDPSDMEDYIRAFDNLLGDDPRHFLIEISQADIDEEKHEMFQSILDAFVTYNIICGSDNEDDDDDDGDDDEDSLIDGCEDEFYEDFCEDDDDDDDDDIFGDDADDDADDDDDESDMDTEGNENNEEED